jgi:hypothetical protein
VWLVLIFLSGITIAHAERSQEPAALIESEWLNEEQVTRGRSADSPAAVQQLLARGRLLVADVRELGENKAASKAQAVMDSAQGRFEKMMKADIGAGPDWQDMYLDVRWALRELAFANPALDFDQLLFVKRQWPVHGHQCSHRVGEAQTPGASLCVLKNLQPDGDVRDLLSGEFTEGGIGRPDLSFDASRVVFPYAAPRKTGNLTYHVGQEKRAGLCYTYDLYEVAVSGGQPRRLTQNRETEDTEPCYLPDGRIAFTSSRSGRLVQCGDWALVCGIYSMDRDGGDVRMLTEPKEGEFYPSMLSDGRILYTRWDYLMKAYNVIQQLWAVNPDGTRAQLVYGDHYRFSHGPITFFEAREIPGTSKVIATGAAHHNSGVGPIVIVDLAKNRGRPDSLKNVTPEIGYPEMNERIINETGCEDHRNMSGTKSAQGWYSSPYPLTEKHYLVSYSFDEKHNSPAGYGLYLQDVHGNRELIYRAKDASCYSPIPLRPRPRPRILPSTVDDSKTTGTLIVEDVYQGLEGIDRGTVKYLRVLETKVKTVHTVPRRVDVGVNSGWDMRAVLGTVPVEEDGSAHFEVPSDKQIFLEALDEDYLEVRRMRNFMSVKPGEVVSCVGCHEQYAATPTARQSPPQAMLRRASAITPPPWGNESLGFNSVVQPVLDKHCTSCHKGELGLENSFDLRGGTMVSAPTGHDRDEGPQHYVSTSFLRLLPFVNYVRVGGYQGEKLPLAPRSIGSHASRLMQLLKDGHYEVQLSQSEWRALAAWIDCNAPFYGDWDEIVIAADIKKQPTILRKAGKEDLARIALRRHMIAADNADQTLLAYLDCGLQLKSEDGNIRIEQTQGAGWQFPVSSLEAVSLSHAIISYDEDKLLFTLAGLETGRAYTLSLSWWDFDSSFRKQSVWVTPEGGKRRLLIPKTELPNFPSDKLPPARLSVEFSAEAESIEIEIKRESGSNAVISEMWLSASRSTVVP